MIIINIIIIICGRRESLAWSAESGPVYSCGRGRKSLRGVGAQSAARYEMGVVADGRLPRGANTERAGHCEVTVADGSPLRGADAESCRSIGPVPESECEASTFRLTTFRKKIEADIFNRTRKAFMQGRQDEKWRTSSTHWPSHWKDLVHDEDGEYDMFGRRTQDGRAVLRQ